MKDAQVPKFRLSLLSRFELIGPDGAVDLPNKKLAGLLAYLTCTAPVPQSRERLATLLWGSHFDTQARANLRQALYRLRQTLGQDALIGDGDEISLAPGVVDSDAGRLKALIREGSRASLAEAVGLYKDGLLTDAVPIAEEAWVDWVASERQRLEGMALDALVRFGEIELALGHADEALETAHRALAINNLREDAHRMIVQALAAAGRKAEALKHYQDLVALLERELNAEPDAATKSLVAELRSTQPQSRTPVVKEVAKPALPQSDQPSIEALPSPKTNRDPEQKVNAEDPAARGSGASSAVAARSATPERRQLTIMVCTMVGSTPHSADPDPEDMRDRIATFHKVVTDVVARFDGFVAQYLSDGVHVYFGYPAAHEHDAERAVRAGLAILDAVGTLKAASDVTLQARVGIATGLVVVGEQLGTGDTRQRVAIGDTPTLAAQLQAVAAPGEIVIAASTRRLVGRIFDCRTFAANEVKGLPQPVEAWQVRGEAAGVSRFEARRADPLSPFVGRQEEIELLLRRWDQAKLGEGRVVLLSGEPGIGKSRIAESLLTRLEGEPHARLRYFCSPHHAHSPLHPFIAQLEQAASFEPGSSAKVRLEKLEALLEPTARNAPRDLALIAGLLSVPVDGRYPALAVSPQQKREMTLSALLHQLDAIAARRPVFIVFEDAHWIDPTSLDLLDRTVARIADLPVLMVITFRPEFQPTWVGQPHVTMLPLSRLGRRDSAGIISGVAKGKALPEAVLEKVFAHADGVPLFIEELTSTLLEGGLLRETPDSYVLDRPLPRLTIPTTLQASLVARLDRLGPVKNVAQIGAAIGREFSHELIAAVSVLAPMDLEEGLDRLTGSGLVSRRGTPPVATYSFKHALVGDAAYATMLKSRRRQLHASIAKALEERFPETVAMQPEVLAHHCTEAGLIDAAIDYWRKAGIRALRASGYIEAVRHLTRGIELNRSQPTSSARVGNELGFQLPLGTALTAIKGYAAPETLRAFSRARELMAGSGTLTEQISVLTGLWVVHFGRGEHIAGADVARQCLTLAMLSSSAEPMANRLVGQSLWAMGEFQEARNHLERSLDLCTVSSDAISFSDLRYAADNEVVALLFLAGALWLLGYTEQADAAAAKALSRARDKGHVLTTALALHGEAMRGAFRTDPQWTETFADKLAAHCTEHKLAIFGHWASFYKGSALAQRGQFRHGIEIMRRAIDEADSIGSKVFRPLHLGHLASAYASLGDHETSLELLNEAIKTVETTSERLYQSELHRLRGELLLSSRKKREAVIQLKLALTVARHQQARFWELRAATSLSRHWRDQGKHIKARDLLAPVLGWFTEGFDLPDLKNARALLEELAVKSGASRS